MTWHSTSEIFLIKEHGPLVFSSCWGGRGEREEEERVRRHMHKNE